MMRELRACGACRRACIVRAFQATISTLETSVMGVDCVRLMLVVLQAGRCATCR